MSPIRGYTDRKRLPRIGKIHLGVKVPNANGQGSHPAPVNWFEVHADATTPKAAAEAFARVYGPEPTELRVVFPSDDELTFADANYKAYGQTHGLVCKGDGETARAKWDPTLSGMRPAGIQSGSWATSETKKWEWMEVPCAGAECPMQKANKCRAVMNLQFFLPDVDGFALWQCDVSSWHSIVNIVAGIDLVKAATGRIRGIELVLRRILIEVQPEGQKKKRVPVLDLHSPLSPRQILAQAQQLIAGGGLLLSGPVVPEPDESTPEAVMDEPTFPIETEDEDEPPTDVEPLPGENVAAEHGDECATRAPHGSIAAEGGCDCGADRLNAMMGETVDMEAPPEAPAGVKPDQVESAGEWAPEGAPMTDTQKGYLFGSATVPKDKALAPRWVAKMGGLVEVARAIVATDPRILPDIVTCIVVKKDGESLAWIVGSEARASALIAALKAELGVKDRKKKAKVPA